MRKPHILQQTETMSTPRRFVYFDSESKTSIAITDDEVARALANEAVRKEHDPYLITAIFKHKSNRGATIRRKVNYAAPDFPVLKNRDFLRQFWVDVEKYARMNEQLYIFAHNAKYDTQVTGCVHYLVKMGYEVKDFSDANPFILTFVKTFTHSPETGVRFQRLRRGVLVDEPKQKTITVISTTNYYQNSLAKLGEVFGLPKLEFDHEEEFTMEKAVEYGERDTEIVERAMDEYIAFIERERLGSLKTTVAGQAFAGFRHRFLDGHEIFIHSDERALKVEREAYAGGRTECFRMGKIKEKVFYVDVNSMYPHVMKEKLFPKRLVTYWERSKVEQVKQIIQDGYLVCCEVYVETDKPMFHKKFKRLVFPVGGFWTSLSTPEIIKGFDEGVIRDVRRVCVYEADNYFEKYVTYFYENRLEAKAKDDAVHDFLYKLFMNVLYGKFGQKKIHWEPVGEADPEIVDAYFEYSMETKQRHLIRVFGGKEWRRYEDETDNEAHNSFPAVAAHVTAYARMLLWDAIETAGVKNVFYTDTDSIMCNEEGYRNLMAAGLLDNKVLGKLKLEKTGKLELFGCKDYIFENDEPEEGKNPMDIKIKGVSKSARRLEDDASGRMRFAVTQWGGFADRLREKSFNSFYNKVIIKTLKREYNKGFVNGAEITPYRFTKDELPQDKQLELLTS